MSGPTRNANPARPVRCSAGCATLVWLAGALPVAADAEFVCQSCTAARAGEVLPTWRCHGCDWTGSLEGAAIHEHNRHEGAQTCWPIDEELDSYRKLSAGAHLADSSEGAGPRPAPVPSGTPAGGEA